MNIALTHYTPNPIAAMEEAACNCYDSKPAGGRIVNACYESGHHSVLEFADFTFHIEGVSRALLAQLTRHRIGISFAVQSQRYCKLDEPTYVTPPSIERNEQAKELYTQFMQNTWGMYNKYLELGIPAEDARFLLPNACTTIVEVKMSGRAMIHFMNERLCSRAQWEIRRLAFAMRQAIINTGDEECIKFATYLCPKCEAGRIWYCPESPKTTCGRQPLWKYVNTALNEKIINENTDSKIDI